MPGDIRAGLRLTADARGFVGEMQGARREVDALSRTVGRSAGPARSAAAATDALERSTGRVPRPRGDEPIG